MANIRKNIKYLQSISKNVDVHQGSALWNMNHSDLPVFCLFVFCVYLFFCFGSLPSRLRPRLHDLEYHIFQTWRMRRPFLQENLNNLGSCAWSWHCCSDLRSHKTKVLSGHAKDFILLLFIFSCSAKHAKDFILLLFLVFL